MRLFSKRLADEQEAGHLEKMREIAAAYPKTMAAVKEAIKDAQLYAFRDGWIEGCDTGMRMVLGEGPPDTTPYTGEIPDELRSYITASLGRLETERAAR